MIQIKIIDFMAYTIIIVFISLYIYNKYTDKLYSCPPCKTQIIKPNNKNNKKIVIKDDSDLKLPILKPVKQFGKRISSQTSSLCPAKFNNDVTHEFFFS